MNLNEGNFTQEVIEGGLPALVDFWAEWCGPCKMMGPIIEEFAKEYEGKIKVGKVNVDEEQTLASQYNIQQIPTLIVFNVKGEVVKRHSGLVNKDKLVEFVQDQL